jgi:uncharacterized membrane-anchored protein YhcB (DUF1043 family)
MNIYLCHGLCVIAFSLGVATGIGLVIWRLKQENKKSLRSFEKELDDFHERFEKDNGDLLKGTDGFSVWEIMRERRERKKEG